MYIRRVWTVYTESMDCVYGEYGLCIRRVWTVYGEYGLCIRRV